MAFERAQPTGELAPQERAGGGGVLVLERGALVDRGAACAGEFLKFRLCRGGRGDGIGLEPFCHARQHRGVDRVGLGQRAARLREPPRAQRIGERNRHTGIVELAMDTAMIARRRLHQHQRHRMLPQAFDEVGMAARIVGHVQPLAQRVQMHIEMRFAYIDADMDRRRCLSLALHSGLAPYHLFRPDKENGRTTLDCGA